MRCSIVPELINYENIEIKDKRNMSVHLCQKSIFKFNPSTFQNPFIVIDNFEKKKYKNIEIKRINLDDLERYGLRLVSVPATPQSRSYPRQNKFYMFETKDSPVPKSEIIYKIPKEHFIEMDTQNNRVRIKGKNAFPYLRNENSSRWVELGKG